MDYHAGFVKQKGQYTPVADTPEGRRAKEAARLASNVVYHGDMAKKQEQDVKRTLGEEGIVKQQRKYPTFSRIQKCMLLIVVSCNIYI